MLRFFVKILFVDPRFKIIEKEVRVKEKNEMNKKERRKKGRRETVSSKCLRLSELAISRARAKREVYGAGRFGHRGSSSVWAAMNFSRLPVDDDDTNDPKTPLSSPLTSHTTLHARQVATTPRNAAAALGDFARGVG